MMDTEDMKYLNDVGSGFGYGQPSSGEKGR